MEEIKEKRKPLVKNRRFKTEEMFLETFDKYLEECIEKEKLPNVSGFAYFARIERKTFYNQQKLYPFAFDLINSALEDETINNLTQPHQIRSLMLMNRYGYTNKTETKNETSVGGEGIKFEFKR